MKAITINGKHYIWRPSILLHNILKGISSLAVMAAFAWMMLIFLTGGAI